MRKKEGDCLGENQVERFRKTRGGREKKPRAGKDAIRGGLDNHIRLGGKKFIISRRFVHAAEMCLLSV